MNSLYELLLFSGLLCLVISLPISLVFSRKLFRTATLSLSLLGTILLFTLSLFILYTGTSLSFSLYEFMPGYVFSLFIDRLAAFFIFTLSLIAIGVLCYSFNYVEHSSHEQRKSFQVFLLNFFLLSMILVILAKNTLSFLIFWELMSLSSLFLVCFDYEQESSRRAGIFYFIMTQLSTVFLLITFIIMYNLHGSFAISPVSAQQPLLNLMFICIFFGFGIKAGVIPFHKWLPYAHPAAPSHISALMSGVMIKVAIYGLLRFLLFVFPLNTLWWGFLILFFGTLSAVLGVIYALKEHDLKRLLAYHSIENIGIILMGVGLFVIFSYYQLSSLALVSLGAALFHTLNHGLFKSILFLTAGSVVMSTGTKNIEEMGGLIKRMPLTALLFLIGAISISALPPFNGFVSELMLFSVLFQFHVIQSPLVQIILFIALALLALTSALAAACFVKAFGMVFLSHPRSQGARLAKEVSPGMLIGPSILALSCMFLGIFSYQIFSKITQETGVSFFLPNLLLLTSSLVVVGILVWFLLKKFSNSKTRISETWGCGILSQNSKMEYTASGFSEPILSIFSFIYQPDRESKKVFLDQYHAIVKEGSAHIHTIKFFEEYLYLPVARVIKVISVWLYKIQNQVALESYILYELLAILALIISVGVFL